MSVETVSLIDDKRQLFIQDRVSLFKKVLMRISDSEEYFAEHEKQTGQKEYLISWTGSKNDFCQVCMDKQFLYGLKVICLSLYEDLARAGQREKEHAKEILASSGIKLVETKGTN